MTHVEIDFESRSAVELRKHGVYNYMASATTEPLMASYSIDGGPVRRWRPPSSCPDDLRQAIESGAVISAHNAAFERLLMQRILAVRYGWPMPRTEQFRCTAATAAAMALPRALDDLGTALDLPIQKDKSGKALIQKFSKPRRPRKGEADGLLWNEPADNADDFERFHDYCDDDVRTEAGADDRMVPLPDFEQAAYTANEIKNDRGIRIDVRSARTAIRLAEKAKKALDREIRAVTGGFVGAVSQPGKLVEWVSNQGVPMNTAQKAEIESLLECDDLPDHVRRAIEIRQEGAKSSVSKLQAMLDRAGADGRVRGTSLYHAASTGRAQSMGVNFSNLPRPRREFEEATVYGYDADGKPKKGPPNAEILFSAIRQEDPDLLRAMYGEKLGRPLHLLSDAIRGFIWAAPGYDLLQADYSGIEGAVIAWSSDEVWKVQEMFEILADPSRPDMYRQTAAGIMNTTTDVITKKHPLRQSVGKVSELACFGPRTRVLTSNGVKAIAEVSLSDKLWDGVEWISHSGLISKGVRPVVSVDGITVTPDHLILTGRTWTPAQQLVSNREMLGQALATGSASLLLLEQNTAPLGGCEIFKSPARAEKDLTASTFTTSEKALALAVINAQKLAPLKSENPITATPTSYPTSLIDGGFLTVYPLAFNDAITKTMQVIQTTVDAVSKFIGITIDDLSLNTSLRFQGGMTRRLNSTEKTSMETTRQEISDSSPQKRTGKTSECLASYNFESPSLNEKTVNYENVYDIAFAGPRNRFTILSDNGAMLVHNCGFGGGVPAFWAMAKNYGVNLDSLFPHVWETASEERREKAVKRHGACLRQGKSAADVLSREAWIACELIKVGWRATNPAISGGWRLREEAIRDAIRNPGTVTTALKFKYVVKLGYLWCLLPSGRALAYASPKLRDQVWAKQKADDGSFSDAEVMDRVEAEKLALKGECEIQGNTSPAISILGVGKDGKMRRERPHGGVFAENDTQAVARDLLENGKRHAEAAGYPVIFDVYDELVTEVPRGFGDVKEFEKLICQLPEWANGLPLTAGGWRGKRYRKD